jgi:phosphatidylserine/phosphatidylglycerophosphate/cardiolipin synthase-like enzyme
LNSWAGGNNLPPVLVICKIAAMKKYLLSVFLLILSGQIRAQLITIADARALPVGSVVTVNGTVTSGPEFGTIRYIQDGTGGMALFSTALSSLQRGDNVTITGTTTEFQNLLEIVQVTAWTVNSTGNALPNPLILPLSQMNESNESMFVRVNNVTFLTSGTFQGNTNYNITSNGESGVVYIRSSNPLAGQPIPTGSVIVYGINSQYGSQYQLLPRDANDIVNASVISISSQPQPENITTTGFDIRWETSMPGNAFLRYGLTPSLELGTLSGPVNTSNPAMNISGASPAQIYYVQCYSINGSDTAFSPVKPYITASNSSGVIKPYFNRPVNNSVANPSSNTAVYLNSAFDDTLKAYIDRSVSTLDIAIYSFDNSSGTTLIAQAINDAWSRGVRVRVITDGGNANNGLQLLNPAIPVLPSPQLAFYYGLMHNKFFIMDADHSDPMRPVVMTGSTNWTNGQLTNDRNNLVFIQDQSLAKVYTIEFEEMWGGSGNLPDTTLMKFGPDKADNTPHILNIGGKKVESYFSPSDNVNGQIIRSIGDANYEIFFATMVLTRTDLAYAIEERIVNHGVYGAGIINDSAGGSGTSFLILQSVLGPRMLEFDFASQPGIMHHKYMMTDQSFSNSDPFILTGSHNWSSAATQRNDENTVIIHDALITNQFYQEFNHMFTANGGTLSVNETGSGIFLIYPNPSAGYFNVTGSSTTGNLKIELMDLTGRMILSEQHQTAGEYSIPVNAQQLSSGIYLIRVNGTIGKVVVR